MNKLLLGLALVASSATAQTAAPRILATSADGIWQLSAAKAGEVTLTPLKQNPNALARQEAATFTNPRYTLWVDQNYTWEASRATFSPRNNYAVVAWSVGVPKFGGSQLDLIVLSSYYRTPLPRSDLSNSHNSNMPTWSSDEKYLAASGGNSVRLWTLGEVIAVKLIDPPAVKGLRLGYTNSVAFSRDSKQLKVSYDLYQKNGYRDNTRHLNAVFSVPDGKLLSVGTEPN